MTTTAVAALLGALPYVDSWLAYRTWKSRVPGVQAAIYFDGKVQFSGSYGVADLASGEPLRADHLFRIASHSKTFTATAILQLVERGALRLDDTVGEHLPALLDSGSPIAEVTVRELLEHGGGVIRDGLDGDYWQHGRPFPDEAELLAMVVDGGAKTSPNDSFNYSNIGYSLLGLIVAAASGVPYNEYVRREIVERLGLRNTGPEWDSRRAKEYAAGHSGFHTSLERGPLDHVDTRAMAAATGFYGTAEDLVSYASAHFFGDERLLTDASKRLQQREQWKTDDSEPGSAHYGLGMIIERIDGHRVIGHSGGYPGHITRTLFDPREGLAISVLTNAIDGPASELSAGVLKLLDAALAQPAALRLAGAAASVAPDVDPGRFVGRFANVWGITDIVRLGDRLVAIHPGGPDPLVGMEELSAVGDDTLVIVKGSGFGSVGEQIRYEFSPDGSVQKIRAGGGMSLWPVGPLPVPDPS